MFDHADSKWLSWRPVPDSFDSSLRFFECLPSVTCERSRPNDGRMSAEPDLTCSAFRGEDAFRVERRTPLGSVCHAKQKDESCGDFSHRGHSAFHWLRKDGAAASGP